MNLRNVVSDYAVTMDAHGRLYDAHGKLWSTDGQEAKFALLPDGRIFAGVKFSIVQDGKKRSLHHSSFTPGPVAAAGLMRVHEGQLLYAISDSGHFQPTPLMMAQFLAQLRASGVNLAGLPIGLYAVGKPSKKDIIYWYDAVFVYDNAAVLSMPGAHQRCAAQQIDAPVKFAPAAPAGPP